MQKVTGALTANWYGSQVSGLNGLGKFWSSAVCFNRPSVVTLNPNGSMENGNASKSSATL